MKIHVLNCGYIRISENLIETGGMMSDLRHAVLTPDPKRVELPVHAFLIEHRNGLFLIDTGLSRDISPAGEYDKKASEKVLTKHLAAVYHPYVPAGMAVHEQLASMGISPAELEAVIITNFDIDHVSGLKHVSDAGRIIVPEDEAYWSVRTKYRIRQNRELWEQQEKVALTDDGLTDIGAVEDALSLSKVQQLVFVEFTSPFQFEVVAVGMSYRWIGIIWCNLLVANGADRESPLGITLVCKKVFTCLHCYFFL